MPGQWVGPAPRWRPMRPALRSVSSRRCPLPPWHRRPWATSAQPPERAPPPKPLDWTAGSVSAPSECRLQSAGVFPPSPRAPQEQFPPNQVARQPQASEQVVRPTSAHPIQRVRPPGAASEEVRVTCGSGLRIHDDPALRDHAPRDPGQNCPTRDKPGLADARPGMATGTRPRLLRPCRALARRAALGAVAMSYTAEMRTGVNETTASTTQSLSCPDPAPEQSLFSHMPASTAARIAVDPTPTPTSRRSPMPQPRKCSPE
jgi:hypothetical protein